MINVNVARGAQMNVEQTLPKPKIMVISTFKIKIKSHYEQQKVSILLVAMETLPVWVIKY